MTGTRDDYANPASRFGMQTVGFEQTKSKSEGGAEAPVDEATVFSTAS